MKHLVFSKMPRYNEFSNLEFAGLLQPAGRTCLIMLEKGSWIWLPDCKEEKNVYADFREIITADGNTPLYLELSADGNYAVYLNGEFVNSGQYPDYPEYKVFDKLELTPWITKGENELLIRVWHPGEDHFSYRKEAPGLLFCVYTEKSVLAVSSAQTLCAQNTAFLNGPMWNLSGQLGYAFAYDTRCEHEMPFIPAAIVEKEVTLYPRPIKKLDIGERLPAKLINLGTFTERPYNQMGERMQNAALAAKYWDNTCIWNDETVFRTENNDDGLYMIFDLGAEQVGFADIEFEVPEDTLVLCGWGEHLHDLRVRSYVGGRNFIFTYYAKAGRNHFFMPLRRLGLRYMQLHFYSPEAKVYYAGIRPTTYPVHIHPLPIKDRLHRKIYETCVQTLRHCMHDHYEDTPWREQGLYTMDSRNEILCGYDVFHETEFPKACLRLIALGVREDGTCELCSPARAPITIPSFSAIWLLELSEYLAQTGDKAFLREMLPYAKRVADGFVNNIDPEIGLMHAYIDKKYWNFYEWQDGLSGRIGHGVPDLSELTYDAPLCAIVSLGLQAMEKICTKLEDPDYAKLCYTTWNKLNAASEKAFWNGEYYNTYKLAADGTLFHGAQLTQALMLCCGACPEEKQHAVREYLKNDTLLPVTLSYSIFKYEALMTDPDNFEWVMDDIAEIWGNMLFQGATTFWETAVGQSDFSNAGSLCHGWSAVPLHLYHKYGTP